MPRCRAGLSKAAPVRHGTRDRGREGGPVCQCPGDGGSPQVANTIGRERDMIHCNVKAWSHPDPAAQNQFDPIQVNSSKFNPFAPPVPPFCLSTGPPPRGASPGRAVAELRRTSILHSRQSPSKPVKASQSRIASTNIRARPQMAKNGWVARSQPLDSCRWRLSPAHSQNVPNRVQSWIIVLFFCANPLLCLIPRLTNRRPRRGMAG